MRIRVTLDKSLIREKPVKKPSSEVVAVFKYEDLPIFCFLCGCIGHIDRACEVRFRFPRNKILPLLRRFALRQGEPFARFQAHGRSRHRLKDESLFYATVVRRKAH
ncbi:hypothetical protein LINGRAHAP2_LOCUS34538 [Linum grandiflorum]